MPPAGPWGSRGPTHTGNPRDAPGAWPEDDHESGIAPQVPPPGAAATAKYKAVEKIEAEIDELLSRATGAREGRGALEKEVEALTERLEVVRMEADEAYARELAQCGS
jgi:collagen type V/XI/XXIV/XXVII alpha